jgi:hypothetical protein
MYDRNEKHILVAYKRKSNISSNEAIKLFLSRSDFGGLVGKGKRAIF